MNDPLYPCSDDTPPLLQTVLRAAHLSLPNLHYTGQFLEMEGIDNEGLDNAGVPEDCQIILFARSSEGDAIPVEALHLEIYQAGTTRSLMLEYPEKRRYPILWLGQTAVWMDGDSGATVPRPHQGDRLEKMGRIILKALPQMELPSETNLLEFE